MKKLLVALLVVVLGVWVGIPLSAQTPSSTGPSAHGSGFTVRPPAPTVHGGFHFIPGFGLVPTFPDSFPVFGQGFDAQHFNAVHGFHGFDRRFHRQLGFGGGFFGNNFFGGGFFGTGFFPAVTSSSVVVVPQVIPVAVPTVLMMADPEPPVVVLPGLPDEWPRLRVAESSYPKQHPPLAQLTLVVLKSQKIFAVTDYWLEGDRLFYVTSTGRQDAVALRDLDWEMTNQLNAERNVDFVIESPR